MTKMVERRFPSPSWAWPTGDLESLLIAAAGADHDRALATAREWISRRDLDATSFHENRLLLAVAARFGRELKDLPEYPRLQGLQRMLWTKSRMATREALPAFTRMTSQGIPLMLVKGAARIARTPEAQKARVSHDIDILVPRERGAEALCILSQTGWTSSNGESPVCLRARLDALRSINLFYGHFGDIDLHMQGFGSPLPDEALEADIWERASAHDYFGVPVLLPAPEHWLAMTLDSSALDAHAHSDWLVDCAVLVAGQPLNQAHLLALLARRGLTLQAEIAFSFLSERLGHDIPFLTELHRHNAGLGPLTRTGRLLQAKPRTDWTPLVKYARGIAKQMRLLRLARRSKARSTSIAPVLRGRLHRLPRVPRCDPCATRVDLPCPGAVLSAFRLELAINLDGINRRYDFELNSDIGHIQRLRVRDIFRRKGTYRMVFSGRLAFDRMPSRLWIEARPGKIVRSQDEAELARYSERAFSMLDFHTAPLAAPRFIPSSR